MIVDISYIPHVQKITVDGTVTPLTGKNKGFILLVGQDDTFSEIWPDSITFASPSGGNIVVSPASDLKSCGSFVDMFMQFKRQQDLTSPTVLTTSNINISIQNLSSYYPNRALFLPITYKSMVFSAGAYNTPPTLITLY
jgi:hypothetical protein